jgi:hypothetical protein
MKTNRLNQKADMFLKKHNVASANSRQYGQNGYRM